MAAVKAVALGLAGLLGVGLCAREARAETARPCPSSSATNPAVNVIEKIAGTTTNTPGRSGAGMGPTGRSRATG